MFGRGIVEVIVDRTMIELNIDVNVLDRGSHKNVFVRCTRCGEEFKRAYRLQHQKHACPTHMVRADGLKLKWCNPCGLYLPYNEFSKNSTRVDGLHSICKTCQNNTPSAKRNNAKKLRNRSILNSWIRTMTTTTAARCKKAGLDFNLTVDYLIELWAHQRGRCYYSDVPMVFGVNSPRSASLERRAATLGYTIGNVVWTTKAMNWAKNNSSEDEFAQLLSEMGVALYNHPTRLECTLLAPDAKLPARSRTTDAGYDIYALESIVIPARGVAQIRTGLALSAPEGYYYTIEGRSSLWTQGVMPYRGIIDGTYTGELIVVMMNSTDVEYMVLKGDRPAQIILHKIVDFDITEVAVFSPPYNLRGQNGFGSTGR